MSKRDHMTQMGRIVVKVGTTTLTYPNGKLNLQRIDKLCWVLADLCNRGREVLLVSSGAIAVGAESLGMSERPRDIIGKQAASSVGQALLMRIYQRFFQVYNRHVAQILLTRDVVDQPIRKENARNTIDKLLSMGIVPIINENDSIATDELEEFGDNDTLSAYVAVLSDSELLVILSDVDGMYDADPRTNPAATIYHEVHDIAPKMMNEAGGSGSALGTGGMATKLSAVCVTRGHGIDTVIASGEDPAVLLRLLEGEIVGTLFTVK